jgi:hypothetical protein
MEHAVIVSFPLSDDHFGSNPEFDAMVILSDALEAAISDAGVGEFDGTNWVAVSAGFTCTARMRTVCTRQSPRF